MFTKLCRKPLRTVALILAVALLMLLGAFEQALAAPGDYGPRAASGGPDPANGVYVSPSGNDATATGAISAPYKSINAALAAAKSGDTIILRGGTYREGVNVRVRIANITIKSREGEWAVIDLTTYNSGHNEDSGVYFDVGSSGGKLQSVEVMGGFYAVCMETKWDWGQPDRSGASNIIIEDCKLHDSRYDVIKVKPNCDNITIRYNEIYNSGRAFDGQAHNGEQNAEGIDNVNGNNMLVQNNYIHNIISNAIYAKGGARDALIENNKIELAYGAGIMAGFDASPEFFDTTVNPHYYENIRGIVRNNLIINTGWEGIGLYAAKDAQIYNNTMVNVNNGGLYHSAIYFGVTLQDWQPYAGRPATVNPSIHHNIVCQPSSFNRQMLEIRFANDLGGLSALDGNPLMSNNCYYIAGRNAGFTDRRPGSALTNAGLSAWKAHISGDSGSLEVDPALDADYLTTNPLCYGMGIGFAAPPSPTYLATVDPTACAYANAAVGYSNASMAQVFAIANSGNQPLTNLTATLGGANFEVSAPLSANTIPISGTANIGVRPKNGLAAGTYNDTLTLHWANDGGTGLTVGLSFTVENAPILPTPTLTLTAAPAASQTYPGNVVLTAALSGAAPNNTGKAIVFTVNGSAYNGITNASGIATYTVTSPNPGQYSFGASFTGDANNAPAAAASLTGYTVNKGAGAAVSKPTASNITASGFTAAATLLTPTGQAIEYAVGTNSATHGAWQSSAAFSGLAPGTDYYIFARGAENTLYNTGALAVSDAVRTLTTPPPTGQTYNIADFYTTSGQLAVCKGDIIIVGQNQYKVLPNTYTINYWSQNSLNTAISWWTDYLNSYAASGVVELITQGAPVNTTYNIADFYATSGQLAVCKGDIIIVGQLQYKVLSATYTISYWSQNSLNSAISWWTDYLNSYAASGVVELIGQVVPVNTTYNIADFYATSGQLAVIKGDIIIVGQQQYKVLSNTYMISYWSQNSLNSAISWWTAYLNSYAASGVVVLL